MDHDPAPALEFLTSEVIMEIHQKSWIPAEENPAPTLMIFAPFPCTGELGNDHEDPPKGLDPLEMALEEEEEFPSALTSTEDLCG